MQKTRRPKKFKDNLSKISKGNRTGANNPNAKLTDEQRNDIIEEYNSSKITYNELSEKYKVHPSTIQKILNKK